MQNSFIKFCILASLYCRALQLSIGAVTFNKLALKSIKNTMATRDYRSDSNNNYENDAHMDHMILQVEELRGKHKNGKGNDFYVAQVVKHVCCLLNGKGGRLVVKWSGILQENLTNKDITDFVRTVEQRVYEIASYEGVNKMETQACYPRHVLFSIEPSTHLCTMNYNLCVPTETQVMSLPPTEPVSSISEIMERQRLPETKIENGSHFKNFVLMDCMSLQLRESKTVQLKMLKAEPSKCVSLADRITSKSNRLLNLASAFANYTGGHVYIGIDPSSYLVEGIHVQEPEIHKIRNKVSKMLTKMIWPDHSSPPQKGKQWDVYFEPVNDREGHRMSNTYVIVIYIAPCLGGVFVDEPESYHVVNGRMERMSFIVWKRKMQASKSPEQYKQQLIRPRRSIELPERIPESTTERKYVNLSEYLQRLRKEGDWRTFDSFTSKTVALQNPTVIPLVVYEQTLAAHMKKEYAKAAKYLAEFKSSRYAVSKSRFDVEEIYLNAVLSRSKGQYEESYNLAKEGLEKNKPLKDDLTTGWFYSLIGSLATILATEVDSNDELVNEAREFNEKALGVVEKVHGNFTASNDLKQAVYINMALLSLNSSIKGLNKRATPDISRIIDAQDYLFSAQRPCVGARTTAEYNSCMSLMAESDLQYRLFQHHPSYSLPHIKSAVTLATKARDIAKSKKFLELLDYSSIRLGFLTEELLNQKLKNGTKFDEQKCILQGIT